MWNRLPCSLSILSIFNQMRWISRLLFFPIIQFNSIQSTLWYRFIRINDDCGIDKMLISMPHQAGASIYVRSSSCYSISFLFVTGFIFLGNLRQLSWSQTSSDLTRLDQRSCYEATAFSFLFHGIARISSIESTTQSIEACWYEGMDSRTAANTYSSSDNN